MAKVLGGKWRVYRADTTGAGAVAFTVIAQMKDLASTGGESNMITTTNRDDIVAGNQEVQQPSTIAPLAYEFTLQFDHTSVQQLDMMNDAVNSIERDYEIRHPTIAVKEKFRGFQKAMPRNFPLTDIIETRTGITVTSPVVIA